MNGICEKHGREPGGPGGSFHLAIDPDSGEILASELATTDDGDASLVGPLARPDILAQSPQCSADGAQRRGADLPLRRRAHARRRGDHPAPLDRRAERAMAGRAVDYGRRSLGEVAMF